MIGLDTNVLVRFLAKDDVRQVVLVRELLASFTAESPGFVSTVTLVETVWVLRTAYRTPRMEIARIVESLLRARGLVIEDAPMHYLALRAYRTGSADYADVVIAEASRRAGCTEVVTFDQRAARSAGMRLLA